MEYRWINLIIVVLATIVPFLWLGHRPKKLKYYFIPFLLFIFIYAGFGAGWDDCPEEYTLMYVLYMLVFGFFCNIFSNNWKQTSIESRQRKNLLLNRRMSKATSIIDKYGGKVVFLYIFLALLKLYLSGKIMNLFSPPQVDLTAFVEEQFNGEGDSLIIVLLNNVMMLLYIFYLISMYKYRKSISKIALFQVLPLYIEYATNAYVGRGEMMMTAMMIIVPFCVKYPQYKRRIIIGGLVLSPLLIYGMVAYSYIRLGREMSQFSMNDITNLLLFQETNYPILYNDISKWDFDPNLASSYFSWIFNLPLPGSLKLDPRDFHFNFIFSERLTGLVRGMPGYSVALPGIVGESVFIFGKYLFWIHAVILAFFLTTIYKLLKYDFEMYLFIYCSVCLAYTLGRAGSTTIYPFYLKLLLFYFIVRYFIFNKRNQYAVYKSKSSVLGE